METSEAVQRNFQKKFLYRSSRSTGNLSEEHPTNYRKIFRRFWQLSGKNAGNFPQSYKELHKQSPCNFYATIKTTPLKMIRQATARNMFRQSSGRNSNNFPKKVSTTFWNKSRQIRDVFRCFFFNLTHQRQEDIHHDGLMIEGFQVRAIKSYQMSSWKHHGALTKVKSFLNQLWTFR